MNASRLAGGSGPAVAMFGMFDAADIPGIEHAVQMAIAPAFLLNGMFAALVVLTNRLARLTDRHRALREGGALGLPGERHLLASRARYIHRAIGCCVFSAILLCLMIVIAFLGVVLELLAAFIVGGLLVGAMFGMCAALLFFLAEIRLATQHLPVDD